MSVVTDKKLIEELNTLSKQNKSPIPTDSEEVTDENLINELEEIRITPDSPTFVLPNNPMIVNIPTGNKNK